MTTEKFSDLWQQIGNVAQDIVNSCHDEVQFIEDKKSYIQYEYDKLRSACRQHLLEDKQHQKDLKKQSSQDEPLLDRHKVASCIAGAILSTRPMEVCPTSEKTRYNLLYFSNESLALFSALGIVKSFIRSDSKNVIGLDLELKSDFLKSGFLFPEPLHSDYLPWLLFVLQESSQIGFNALSFSNILYLLETYTFKELRIKQLEKKIAQ